MFGSSNDFFKQDKVILLKLRGALHKLLAIKGRSDEDIEDYLRAFDFFTDNPKEYDGATLVKDLVDIRYNGEYLDADAMLHDYEYIFEGANKSFVLKWGADLKYIKNMEKNGKGIRVPRMVLLTVLGILFVPYVWIKNF